MCLEITWDTIASLRVDSSECFSLTYIETSAVRGSEGYPGVGDKNIPEFFGDSDGPFLECAEESLELFAVRTLAKRVLPGDDHFVQTDGDVSGTQVQTTAACSPWQSGRVGPPRKWRTKRFRKSKSWASVVSCEVVRALNQRAGGWESPSNTSAWSANEGLRRTDGTRRGRFPFERGRRKRRTGKTFHHSASARQVLGSAVLA